MQDIISTLWKMFNYPISLGDITFKFIYLTYIALALFIFKAIFYREK